MAYAGCCKNCGGFKVDVTPTKGQTPSLADGNLVRICRACGFTESLVCEARYTRTMHKKK